MKKLIMIALTMLVGASFADTNDVALTDTYKFKAAIKVPYLSAGVRTYKSQAFQGYMYVGYTEDGEVASAKIELQNKKTKVKHYITVDEFMYNLMGKKSKTSIRSVPTVFIKSDSDEVEQVSAEAHELFKTISLAGTGALKYMKGSSTTLCGFCGTDTVTTAACNRLAKMSGSLVGIMDCECPEEENWSHTLLAGYCGVLSDEDGNVERSHDASFWGTWSATLVK